jgi:YidC/Oxa1 family membrane protein insertase
VLDYLYDAVSWVLLRWHQLFTALGLDPTGGLNWTLSIIFLVVTARVLLFRMFIKQVHYQRHMQEIQPKIQALREKYKNDKAEMQRQMMTLQQEQGFNPLAGCLPMFLQIPIFLSLYHVLRHLANAQPRCHTATNASNLTLYSFTKTQTCDAANSKLFNAPLAAALRDSSDVIHRLGGSVNATHVVTLILVAISAGATYFTQRLVVSRQTVAPVGTAATIQRLMKVFIPISVLFSGVIFPLGVCLYWFTSNTWTLAQQAYINRFHPPTASTTAPTGTLGKTLAPKPGQRPDRSRPNLSKEPPVVIDQPSESTPPRSTSPRPGQKPARQGGNRPPGNRPSQAKKRR